jgi:XapX domain-containing protein
MKVYLTALGAGLLVGVVYSLLQVRSPAPPLIALVGLLGILMGEQILPLGKHLLRGASIERAWKQADCAPHMFGMLPSGSDGPRSSKGDA